MKLKNSMEKMIFPTKDADEKSAYFTKDAQGISGKRKEICEFEG
jgi:hypothetical protein